MIRQLKQQAEQAQRLPEPVVAPIALQESSDVGSCGDRTMSPSTAQSLAPLKGTSWEERAGSTLTTRYLLTAAVHAGILKEGEIAVVQFTVLPGQETYPSLTRHGVSSSSWQSWGGSYRIEGPRKRSPVSTSYVVRNLPPFAVYVVGRLDGRVWGSGSYTDDSDLGTAAVHAGLLKPGEAVFCDGHTGGRPGSL